MNCIKMDGKEFAKIKLELLKERVIKLKNLLGDNPTLATILVGDDYASKRYVDMKEKMCEKVGIKPLHIWLENSTLLKQTIVELNNDSNVNGILVQHPVYGLSSCEEQEILDNIVLEKDVDGLTSLNRVNMYLGNKSFIPCTPKGIIELLNSYNIDISGKHAVIIGRSAILGEPLRILLNKYNATTTVIHSKSENIIPIIKQADIVFACVGIPEFVKKDWVKDGVVLIDAGYNAGNIGDIEKGAYDKSSYYTPVPGGVGPVTIQMLMENTIDAFEEQKRLILK